MSLSANGQKDFGDSFGADILTRMCSNKEKLAASNGIKYYAFNCDMLLETLKFELYSISCLQETFALLRNLNVS